MHRLRNSRSVADVKTESAIVDVTFRKTASEA